MGALFLKNFSFHACHLFRPLIPFAPIIHTEPHIMSTKFFPLTLAQTEQVAQTYPTPFHLYDEAAIRKNARQLTSAFSVFPGFREYFAVKAAPKHSPTSSPRRDRRAAPLEIED